MIPAIVLSSHTIGLAVIRALGVKGVPVKVLYYDDRDMGFVSRYVTEKVKVPHPEKHEKRFISLLLDYSRRSEKSILFPADDVTLKIVSKNRELLKEHYIVACTGWDITEKFIDKKFSYALAESIGIPCPRSMVPATLEDAERFGRDIGYPCLVKPCESHRYFALFRRKMVRVENGDQLIAAYQEAAEAGLEVMVQEYIPGDDNQGVNYNSYCWEGEALVEFTAEKVRLAPPSFGVPRTVVSKKIPDIIEPGRKILQAMGYHGFSCTEFKRDSRDGVFKFMEVNGRHNRSGLLALRCGINFPWIEYSHLAYGERPRECGFREGVYWIDEVSDLVSSIKFYRNERYTVREYLGPYKGEHIFAVCDAKDIMPFAKRCLDLGRMVFQRLLRQIPSGDDGSATPVRLHRQGSDGNEEILANVPEVADYEKRRAATGRKTA